METEVKKSSHEKSFLQDPTKLTFALGLTSGLAVMAIVGMILLWTKDGGSSKTSANDTNTVADTSGTTAGASAAPDPKVVAATIGLDEDKFSSCLSSKKNASRVDRDITAGNTIGVNGTPTSFINGTAVSGALPYAQIKAAIDAAISGTKGTTAVPAIAKDDHITGKKDAKVLIVEYSDFECPFCRQFYPTLKQAMDEYGNQVALVYRHFPLESIHPSARILAEGSECAYELGGDDKFWQFHDLVFQG